MLTEIHPSPACQPAPPRVLRQALQRRQTNQRSPVPPRPSHSHPTSLYRSHLTSEVWCSAVLHTLRRLPASSCSFLSLTRARRQELLHHPALTGGKTAQGCSAVAQGGWMRGLRSHQGQVKDARTCRYVGNDDRKYLHAEICKHQAFITQSIQNCVKCTGKLWGIV